MQFFKSSKKEDIHAVGLVFEPNFFRVNYYQDREAQNLAGTENVAYGSAPEIKDFSKLYPLYALTFNAHYTLMPNDLFEEDQAQEILAFNTASKSPNVDWNSDPTNKAKIIFERDIHSEQYLDSVFPGLQLRHGVHALLAYARNFKLSEVLAVLVKSGEKFTLAIFESNKVKFINTIDAKHTEDIVYFLLYTLKTLDINLNTPLILLGFPTDDNGLKTALEKYLPSVSKGSSISTNLPLSEEEVAAHWIGVHASLCAL